MTSLRPTDFLTWEFAKFIILMLTGTFCYLISKGSNNRLKLKFAKFYGLMVPLLCFPVFLLRPRNSKNISAMAFLTGILCWFYGLKFETRGIENISKKRSGVMVINHQNVMDAVGLVELSRAFGKLVPIMKKELLPLFPFGPCMWLCGAIFISRHDPKVAYKDLKESRDRVLADKGTKIVFYPEGTRNMAVMETRKLLPFRKGAFQTAIDCQVPICPVVNSPFYFYSKNRFTHGSAIMEVLPPIETTGLTQADVDDLMTKTAILMQDTWDRLYKEVMDSLPKKYRNSLQAIRPMSRDDEKSAIKS